MFTKLFVISSSLVLILATGICAQGEFLRPGETGLGVTPRYVFGNGVDAQGITFGLSASGHFDISVSYAENSDRDTQEYSGIIAGHLGKKSNRTSMTGSVISFGYHVVDYPPNTVSGSTLHFWLLGLDAYYSYYPNSTLMLNIGGSFLILYSTNKDAAYDFQASDFSIGVSTSAVFAHEGPLRPFITLGIAQGSVSDDDLHGFIAGGLIWVW